MQVTVFGATGNTGGAVTRHLLRAGATVRAVTRDRRNAEDLGVQEIMEWDWQRPGAFREALHGADAAYFMCPVGLHEGSLYAFRDEYSRRFAAAARAASGTAPTPETPATLRRVVQLSSFGADIAAGSGVLEGLHAAEENLAGCVPNRIILRPGYFWQNFRANVEGVRDRGFLGGYPIEPETRLLFADTTEIGRVAAELLLDGPRRGEELYYTGHPTLYSFREIASALADHLDRPDLVWTNVGYDAAREHMAARSMPVDLIDNFLAFFAAINSGTTMEAYSSDLLIPQHFGLDDFLRWFADLLADDDSLSSSS